MFHEFVVDNFVAGSFFVYVTMLKIYAKRSSHVVCFVAAAGRDHIVAITVNNVAVSWGRSNEFYQCGQGTNVLKCKTIYTN